HPGGTHVHTHAELLLSPPASHEHSHDHPHTHHHSHAAPPLHSHSHTHAPSPGRSIPVFRQADFHPNGHWHTATTLQLTKLGPATPSLPRLHVQFLPITTYSSPHFAPRPVCQARAPPSLF